MEVEEKYAKARHELEKKTNELRTIKRNLHMEKNSNKKLDALVKDFTADKQKLEKQVFILVFPLVYTYESFY